jgi:predicted phosphodiesterase
MTGDLINSDRRLDEILAMATNRSKATFLATAILQQFVLDLNEEFNILIAGVSGNESRMAEEFGFNDIVATDNYDFTILEMLKLVFRNSKGVQFVDCASPTEGVIEIEGSNILIIHGYAQRADIEKYIQQVKGRYSSKGVKIDYVLLGHLHSCRIGDSYARGSSLAGANAYSENSLNMSGRASQNIFIMTDIGDIHGTRIDLQNTDGIVGYDIEKEIIAYNPKSVEKSHKGKKNYKIVI